MRLKGLVVTVFFVAACLSAAIPDTPGWYRIPDTKLQTVDACFNGYDYACGNTTGGIFAWSGGIFDTLRNRMIVFGGGHTDYRGNELYSMDPDAGTMTRITVPGYPTASGCQEAIANGTQPNSRHTYDGICYMEHIDRMFVFGGSLACGPGNGGRDMWTYDFAAQTWHRMTPSGTLPGAVMGLTCDYDPNTGHVFIHDRSYLYEYNFEANTCTQLSGSYIYGTNYYHVSVIDPVRKKYVFMGNGESYIYDISGDSGYACRTFGTTGGNAVPNTAYPGLEYDPERDRIVAWIGGEVVYTLNMDTRQWSSVTYSGGPGSTNSTGTYKRWSYSPRLNCFVLVNKYAQDAYTFRFPGTSAAERTAGGGAGFTVTATPNPFRTGVTIAVSGQRTADSKIRIAVYNTNGKIIHRLSATSYQLSAGITIDARNLPSGIYLLKAAAAGKTVTKRLFLQK